MAENFYFFNCLLDGKQFKFVNATAPAVFLGKKELGTSS